MFLDNRKPNVLNDEYERHEDYDSGAKPLKNKIGGDLLATQSIHIFS